MILLYMIKLFTVNQETQNLMYRHILELRLMEILRPMVSA